MPDSDPVVSPPSGPLTARLSFQLDLDPQLVEVYRSMHADRLQTSVDLVEAQHAPVRPDPAEALANLIVAAIFRPRRRRPSAPDADAQDAPADTSANIDPGFDPETGRLSPDADADPAEE